MAILVTLIVTAPVLYFFPRALDVSPAQPGRWDLAMAVVVAGYLVFPIAGLIAGGLLVVALLMLAGAAIERR